MNEARSANDRGTGCFGFYWFWFELGSSASR